MNDVIRLYELIVDIETIKCTEPSRPIEGATFESFRLWEDLDTILKESWDKLSRREIEERLNANKRQED